ncbi:hypothetical protein CDD82_5093 [Ophiocordyceps australis]|uniref:6-phosphogluconolactonase n=1 Tax=Ophiocordyceps australis TaxID=1399860 RepID=A0A2C5XIZ6_9HYPO|nr:hypothetical protein CDD82_5093 [Ophiocordyceps australis]
MAARLVKTWAMLTLLLGGVDGQQQVATLVYVSSYSGNMTTLALEAMTSSARGISGGMVQLQPVDVTDGCGASPSFLTLDAQRRIVFCVNEDLDGGRGSLGILETRCGGRLTPRTQVESGAGPVFSALFEHGRGLAVANYAASSISTFDVSSPCQPSLVATQAFALDKPGPVPDRQSAPRPHQAIVDPTGRFLAVPDLGADVVRLFHLGKDLRPRPAGHVAVKPGSGPRHAAFVHLGHATFMYLVNELSNTIDGFRVTYSGHDAIHMEPIFTMGTHGGKEGVESNHVFASEIVISPDKRFVIVSSRNESALSIPNFDASDPPPLVSDPLINFRIDPQSGALHLLQDNVPAGGRFPRHFSLNRDGSLLAVGLQLDSRVAFIQRDAASGEIGNFVAYADVAGQVTSVIFDD